jgi:DNA replication protein DnaC
MSNAACEAVIQEYCRELKLAAVVRVYPGLCRRARDGGWAYEDLLRELLEAEISNRHQSTTRRLLREARFPDIKTLEQLDWAVLKGVAAGRAGRAMGKALAVAVRRSWRA